MAMKRKRAKCKGKKCANRKPKAYTALEAVCYVIESAGLGTPKPDGSDLIKPFATKNGSPEINTIEFIAAWDFLFSSNEISDALGYTIQDYFKSEDKKVKDLAGCIHRAFKEDPPSKRFTDVDGGEDCPHYEKRDDLECLTGIKDCYSCKFWDNAHLDRKPGEMCDCTIGECTWKWKDPNGDSQKTFPFMDEQASKRVVK